MHGKGWKKIAKLIKTRTVVQIRTHAQKYFQKLAKAKKNGHHGDMLGMEGSRFGGKRVKFTGKRRGLVYGSYLVGVEATSAAISPALQTYMPTTVGGVGGEQAGLLTDKEEDAAIEKGLYRFLSPVVLDPATRNLDAAAPEVLPLPPSTPAMGAHHTSSSGSSSSSGGAGGMDGETTGEEDGGSDAMEVGDGGSDHDAESSLGEPLPTLAKVTPEMYVRCGVPEWFKKGGDIDELLTEAAGVDWRLDSGGDARKVVEQGTSILNANIINSSSSTSVAVPPAVVRRSSSSSSSSKMASVAPAVGMVGVAGAGGALVGKGKGSGTSDGSSNSNSSSRNNMAPTASAGGGRGTGGGRGGQQKKKQQQQVQPVQEPPKHALQQQQQQHDIHVKEEGMVLLVPTTVHAHVHAHAQEEEDDFAAFDPHHVELKEEHSHHGLLLEELHHDGDDDDALAHIVFSASGESDVHPLPVGGGGGGGGHVHTAPGVVGGSHHHHHHNDHDVLYDAYLEEAGAEGGHGLLLLEDLDGGIEF